MLLRLVLAACVLLPLFGAPATAQIIKDAGKVDPPTTDSATEIEAGAPSIIETAEPVGSSEVTYGTPIATRYRVGAKVVAKGKGVDNIFIMVAVPLECAEQQVQVLEEDFSPNVEKVDFRLLPPDDGVRQMLITIPTLPARQEAHAYVTYDVLTKPVIGPEHTATLRAPVKPEKALKLYLSASPFIDVNHRKIRDAVKQALAALEKKRTGEASEVAAEPTEDAVGEEPNDETPVADATQDVSGEAEPKPTVVSKPIIADSPAESSVEESTGSSATEPTDWERAEAFYDYALEHVKYEEGVDKSSVQVLKDGKGDCQAIGALFVAMCRTAKIPARLVWVEAHQYAEFYLEDEAGKGHWYPVETAGRREFGEMSIARVILQKGDNFRVPERRRERLRYASDFTMLLASPEHQPRVTYIREQL